MSEGADTPQADETLLGATALYGIANAVQALVPVLLIPVLAYYLSREDFGHVAMFTAVVGLAMPVTSLNAAYSVRRQFFTLPARDFGRYWTHTVALVVAATALATLGVWALAGPLSALAGLSLLWLLLAVLHAGGQGLITLPLTLWQVRRQPRIFAAVQIARALVLGGLTLLLAIAMGLGWQGVAGAMVLTTALIALVCAPTFVRTGRRGYRKPMLKHALQHGTALIPHTMGMLIITSTDRFFLTHYQGAEETGVYWLGYQFGYAVTLVADAYNRAFSPWLYGRLAADVPSERMAIVRRVYRFFAAMAVLAALLVLLTPFVVRWVFPAEFLAIQDFAYWIILGFAFNGCYRVIAGFVFYAERTKTISAITLGTAVCNVGLNALWVPSLGASGAAQATALSFALGLGLTWLAAQRAHPMPWSMRS
jgi:O-antigen/teichoic acid export membrane protein